MITRFYVATLLLASFAVGNDDINSMIDEVFGKPPGGEGGRSVQGDCTCVPYYLCNNNTIVTDGTGIIDVRAREGPCESYLEVCCNEPITESERQKPTSHPRTGCGRHNAEGVGFRITGDEQGEAQFGEFPWMVAVLHEEDDPKGGKTLNIYQCGGALIHPQVVMTAAHCVTNQDNYKIRAGEWDTQTNNELFSHQDVKVRKIIIHPQFYSGALYNDVALLLLESEVNLVDNVDVVCLPKQGEVFDRSRCYASGWGKNQFGKEGSYQVILKKVDLPIVPRNECEEALRKTRLGAYFRLHESFVCAGGEHGRDTCKGDGGSPLVCPIPGMGQRLVQVGIVSWGIGCGAEGTPGVYAGVATFRKWIDEELSNHNLDINYYAY